jgi:hypothetical protein
MGKLNARMAAVLVRTGAINSRRRRTGKRK